MTYKEILTQLVNEGKMWSWPYLRDCVDSYSEEDCRQFQDIIIEKWLCYHYEIWEVLLSLPEVNIDSIFEIWQKKIKPQGNYFQYANEYLADQHHKYPSG